MNLVGTVDLQVERKIPKKKLEFSSLYDPQKLCTFCRPWVYFRGSVKYMVFSTLLSKDSYMAKDFAKRFSSKDLCCE